MDNTGESYSLPCEGCQPTQALPTGWSELVSAVESLTEVFFTLDRHWHFTYVNAETEEYLGRSRAELLGKCIWDECPQLRGTAYETQARVAVEQSSPCAFELYDPARKRWKELHILPSASGVAVTCVDTSERKLRQDAERDNSLRFQVVARATSCPSSRSAGNGMLLVPVPPGASMTPM
ncbi:PAS domain-containing protein [Noviherbaspirillum sp. Root189]|uniref:PAS domain-containing protein n=1 Tax=Noviherbaspirillum sp. Root189 TaxID=1736487 RepID=UPI0007101C02|nr:PAS domain-containing protein [Noviherbaspirillum sp. Root189]KRB82166.1 hypothetical protein ASE07_24020 [Noviherbaspirillum sp. Root189]